MVAWAMPPTTNFYKSRRKTVGKTRGKRVSKTEQHLRDYLATYDAMTPDERAESARLGWMPPREIVEALLSPTLLQRDRVELVIVSYSVLHPGHTPSWDEIGRVLGIAYQVAAHYGRQLISAGRAEKRDGRFCLKPAGYSHPIVRARFPSLFRLLNPVM